MCRAEITHPQNILDSVYFTVEITDRLIVDMDSCPRMATDSHWRCVQTGLKIRSLLIEANKFNFHGVASVEILKTGLAADAYFGLATII